MKKTLLALFAVALLAAVVLTSGCGGGGGGGNSGGDGGNGSTGTRPSGTIFSQFIVGTAPNSTVCRSLANMEVGDTINLRSLALYINGGYSGGFYEDLTNIVVTTPGVVTLTGTSLHADAPGTVVVNATGANNAALSVTVTVSSANLASVSGTVRGVTVNNNTNGIATVNVIFYDASASEVARVRTGPDGRYQANIPTTAVSFVANFSELPNSFYNQFTLDGLDYSATECTAPLPTLSTSSNTTIDDAIAYRKGGTNPPPPPPSGCGG